jgi:hypothetical protein
LSYKVKRGVFLLLYMGAESLSSYDGFFDSDPAGGDGAL